MSFRDPIQLGVMIYIRNLFQNFQPQVAFWHSPLNSFYAVKSKNIHIMHNTQFNNYKKN